MLPDKIAANEVSIPSRRVGDLLRPLLCCLAWCCFHPLKAGRRPFHPIVTLSIANFVSIPSRRVGDRTCFAVKRSATKVSIPSRRVGDDERVAARWAALGVSIPSRRVGDILKGRLEALSWKRFHPLKAGRRPLISSASTSTASGFHPLKAGRRRKRFHRGSLKR